MKTIELMINGQKAQFTTKSVTIDDKEYLYSHMTTLDHSPVVHTYRFEYDDGDSKLLTYEKKDAKIMAAIFSQVHKMIDLKKSKAAEQPTEAPASKEALQENAKAAESAAEVAKVAENPKATEATAVSDDMDEMVKATIAINEERTKKEAEKARKKAAKKAKKNGTPLPEDQMKEDSNKSSSEDALPVDPEKQARVKKSLIVFGVIIAVVIAASLIYYFVFGTSNAPSDTGAGVTESQQYEDIDQLIDDLQ